MDKVFKNAYLRLKEATPGHRNLICMDSGILNPNGTSSMMGCDNSSSAKHARFLSLFRQDQLQTAARKHI